MVAGPNQTQDCGAAVDERAHGPLDLRVGDDLGHEGESRSAVPFAVGQHGGREPPAPAGDGLVAIDDVPVVDELAQGRPIIGGDGQRGGSGRERRRVEAVVALDGGPGRGGVPGEEMEPDFEGGQLGLDDRRQGWARGHLGRGDLAESVARPTFAEGEIGSFRPLQGQDPGPLVQAGLSQSRVEVAGHVLPPHAVGPGQGEVGHCRPRVVPEPGLLSHVQRSPRGGQPEAQVTGCHRDPGQFPEGVDQPDHRTRLVDHRRQPGPSARVIGLGPTGHGLGDGGHGAQRRRGQDVEEHGVGEVGAPVEQSEGRLSRGRAAAGGRWW